MRVVREETARVTASMVRLVGDFDLAEDAVQDAIVLALEHWPKEGIPRNPGAWLTTAARRKAIDRLRRESRYGDKLRQLEAPTDVRSSGTPDERLELIFACCHPALAREAQLALTLRAVVGLTTGEIARAFVATESTIAQRIVRAKRKIVEAGIPLRVPEEPELRERLGDVLAVLYLMFNEGYLATAERADRRDLAEDAEWLASLVVALLPGEPEALGLLALMRLHLARHEARFRADGSIVLLADQDRALWDRARIGAAVALLGRATEMRRPGRYQIEAAIAAMHGEAGSYTSTDWPAIVRLYDALLERVGSPVVALNRAIAVRHVSGPERALREVEALGPALERYHLYHATRAELLRALGRHDEARTADERALALTENPAERELLRRRIESA